MNALPVLTSREELRRMLAGAAPGLVPTMGALHAGHAALIERSARENPVTVVSLFVNPLQFNDPRDFERYPRSLERDASFAAATGATLLYAPAVDEIYPGGHASTVHVDRLGARWEGASRPNHFTGVATVVSILLNQARPARSYFGEKDYQQLQIVRRMHRDLSLPGEVISCPTIRDPFGLALSSRNQRLSETGLIQARVIPRAMHVARTARAHGQDGPGIVAAALAELAREPAIAVDYCALVDPETLEPVDIADRPLRLLVAVWLESVRLIDNCAV